MVRTKAQTQEHGKRTAIYAHVSDKSQAEDDKTSLSEQTTEMEAYCESKGLNITARYQEVGRGWSKKRPEFQRMLADAKKGRFDTIVCWKSDRLSRGMYPAAALMEVVEAYQISLEAVMDAIDMKTFGLMAAIGKIELDNFRERATMGKRGTAKQGRIPSNGVPFGYRIGDDGRPEVVEAEAEAVRLIFRLYVYEGMGAPLIAQHLDSEAVPMRNPDKRWHHSHIHRILDNETYRGTWWYGRTRQIATEDGLKVYEQPKDTWIGVPFPSLVDEQTWDRVPVLKKQRMLRAKRNTKLFCMLLHIVRCAECGRLLGARTNRTGTTKSNGKTYAYELDPPRRYYQCYGMKVLRLNCRKKAMIRAERLEDLVWGEVKRIIQHPEVIVAGIDTQDDGGWEKRIADAERDLHKVQMEEDRAIRLFVSDKITEDQLDHQRRFITERLESLRYKLDKHRAQQSMANEKRVLMENLVEWAGKFREGLDDLSSEERRRVLLLLVDQVLIDRDNSVNITLAIPTKALVSIASLPSSGRRASLSFRRSRILRPSSAPSPGPHPHQVLAAHPPSVRHHPLAVGAL